MNAFQALIERTLADPLGLARAHVSSGGRAVGYVGNDVPVEIILAADALPIRLEGRPEAPTPNADRYLEGAFPPAIRSIAEQWLTGQLDMLDAVVLPRSSDAAQRLYYYVCELQRTGRVRGPRPLIYDVARIRRASSRAHTIEATIALAEELGAPSDLAHGVSRVRQRRTLLCELRSLRLARPALAGSFGQRVFRASELAWTSDFDRALSAWLDEPPAATGKQRRFLLVGSTPPDERLHLAVEQAGSTIVEELCDATLSMQLRQARVSAPTLEAIGAAQHESATFGQWLMEAQDALVARAEHLQVHGAIVWMIEEDEGIAWELASQVDRLTKAGIPTLSLPRQSWVASADALEAIARFTRAPMVAA
jgi:hypothetical protein